MASFIIKVIILITNTSCILKQSQGSFVSIELCITVPPHWHGYLKVDYKSGAMYILRLVTNKNFMRKNKTKRIKMHNLHSSAEMLPSCELITMLGKCSASS